MANSTEDDWDEAAPSASGVVSQGDDEIRVLRASTRNRLEKEHVKPAGSNAGGEHLAGSAKTYSDTAAPTKRPDSVNDSPGTSLTNADKGRLWFDETTLQLKRYNGTAWVVCGESYAKLSATYAAATAGGTLTQDTWNTRPLNTEDNDVDGIVSLAANQFTLGAGKYRIEAWASGNTCACHQIRLRNITDGSTTLSGMKCHGDSGVGVQTAALLRGEFTITGTKVFEIQHNCQTTKAVNGMGISNTFTGDEASVHAIVEIRKLVL
jgi:hypothetical protein